MPMNVPSVSNTSDIENAKIVTSTSGRRPGFEKSEPKPSPVNSAPNVCGSWPNASPIEIELFIVVRPIGMPMTVVMAMASSMPPLILRIVKTMTSSRPMRNNHSVGLLNVARPGVAPVDRPLPADSASFVVNVMRSTLSRPTYATNRPMPPPIACCSASGMARMIIWRTLVTVMRMLIRPHRNTMHNVSCHVKPRPKQTV